eukprot:548524-Rhodomonas_salina.1
MYDKSAFVQTSSPICDFRAMHSCAADVLTAADEQALLALALPLHADGQHQEARRKRRRLHGVLWQAALGGPGQLASRLPFDPGARMKTKGDRSSAGSECAKTAGTEDPKKERERKNINQSLVILPSSFPSLHRMHARVCYSTNANAVSLIGSFSHAMEQHNTDDDNSWLTLGRVISALRDGNNQRIPYRDSKLTRLLQVRPRRPRRCLAL